MNDLMRPEMSEVLENRMSKATVIKIYKVKSGWRWRMTDKRNGKIIGASSEGYRRRIDCVRNLRRVGEVGCGAMQ